MNSNDTNIFPGGNTGYTTHVSKKDVLKTRLIYHADIKSAFVHGINYVMMSHEGGVQTVRNSMLKRLLGLIWMQAQYKEIQVFQTQYSIVHIVFSLLMLHISQ